MKLLSVIVLDDCETIRLISVIVLDDCETWFLARSQLLFIYLFWLYVCISGFFFYFSGLYFFFHFVELNLLFFRWLFAFQQLNVLFVFPQVEKCAKLRLFYYIRKFLDQKNAMRMFFWRFTMDIWQKSCKSFVRTCVCHFFCVLLHGFCNME